MDLSVLGGTYASAPDEREEDDAPALEPEVLDAVFEPVVNRGVERKKGKRRRLEAYIAEQTDDGRALVDHALAAMRNELLSPRDQARAREFLADRLFGKTVSIQGAVKHTGRIEHDHEAVITVKPYDLARLTDAELAQMEALATRAALPDPDAV